MLCGQGYTPTIEDVNRLNEIDEKLKQYSSKAEWQNKGLDSPKNPIGFSWTGDQPLQKKSSLVITDDGVIKRIPVGKHSGIDYLREQREERLQKRKMQDINDSIAALYTNTEPIKLTDAQLSSLVEQCKKELETQN